MDIQISAEAQQFLAEQVASGRYPSEAAVIEAALESLRGDRAETPPKPEDFIGIFADCPELIDEIVEEAMQIRESRPWRLPPDE
jgi:hypothetical protein